jgi:DNA ligase (NAD+)
MINRLNHFCGKNGLDIKGFSKATLEKLMEWEWIENIIDIFSLKEHRTEWIQKAGFGPKSVDNILNAIEEAKTTTIEAFISSLGIPLIGKVVAADLMKHFKDYHEFREAVNNKFDFSKFESFAESKTEALWNYDYTEADEIFKLLIFNSKEEKVYGETCVNLKFVITGKLTKFKNRNEFKELIEINGGKVIDSVSKNTSYLINNDITSTSGKNKEAQKLGIPIISEEEFFEKFFKNS